MIIGLLGMILPFGLDSRTLAVGDITIEGGGVTLDALNIKTNVTIAAAGFFVAGAVENARAYIVETMKQISRESRPPQD